MSRLTQDLLKLLPDSFNNLDLNLVKKEEVGVNIFAILLSCVERFYDGSGKRKINIKIEDEIDITDRCRFLIDFTWEQLNIGNWKDVSLSWRYLYSYASLFGVLSGHQGNPKSLQELCRACDMGLLMGAPVLNNILAKIASRITREIRTSAPTNSSLFVKAKRVCSKRDLGSDNLVHAEVNPSLEHFLRVYYQTQKPVRIQQALLDWPALTTNQWSVEYILQVAGCRTVPVEIGSKYTDDSWSQKLMTLQEFVERFISNQSTEGVGYCAQHQLLNQIEELSEDIATPVYCCVGDEEPDINCWFGPAGTVSPLHFDPKDNCLAQVFGEKYICLYPPEATEMLYPHSSHLLDNTSQVDLENPDLERFPLFRKAQRLECVLKAGELLFIPKKWWHFVCSLDTSFSISFWWK